jgi:hypothetical protein
MSAISGLGNPAPSNKRPCPDGEEQKPAVLRRIVSSPMSMSSARSAHPDLRDILDIFEELHPGKLVTIETKN